MNKQLWPQFCAEISDYVEREQGSAVSAEAALLPSLAGMRLFDEPLFAVAGADDELFCQFGRADIIGPWFKQPQQWLAGARSVIAIYLPFSEEVTASNRLADGQPSPQWLHARFEGQQFVNQAMRHAVDWLAGQGFASMAPSLDAAFASVTQGKGDSAILAQGGSFTSNWSERHAAYVAGLGSFGLSKSLITKQGAAGRFASIITAADLPITERAYQGVYDYCTNCGACVRRCPAAAISLEEGKQHAPCSAYLDQTRITYAPRYGCGKCQTGVPCQNRAPGFTK